MDTSMIEALASYVPVQLLQLLLANPAPARKPSDQHFDAAVLVAEMEGFHALFERLHREEADAGVKKLSQVLNAYYPLLVDFVRAEGGDILSLTGDRALALWRAADARADKGGRRSPIAALTAATRRAVQSALSLQKMLHQYEALEDLRLDIRISVSAGKVLTACVGGALGRWEFLTSGEAVGQACALNREAAPGDILLTPEAYALMRTQSIGQKLENGSFRLENVRFPLPSEPLESPVLTPEISAPLRAYIPGAVLNSVTTGQTEWLAELRQLTLLYINLPTLHYTTPLEQIHNTMRTMQRALYRHSGSVSKLRLEDAGMVMAAALGLPPLTYTDTAPRGVQAALLLADELQQMGLPCQIGVATGPAFCCSVGSPRRREYTMIGAVGDRAWQAMTADAPTGGILCDAATYEATKASVAFAPSSAGPFYCPKSEPAGEVPS